MKSPLLLLVLVGLAACRSFGASDDPPPAAVDDGGAPDAADAASKPLGARFCDAHAGESGVSLCLDFDEPAPPASPFGFESVEVTPQGAVSFALVPHESGRALRADMLDGDGQRAGYVWSSLGAELAAATRLEVSFSLRIVSTTDEYAALGALFFGGQTSTYVGIAQAGMGSQLESIRSGDPVRTGVVGRWHSVVLRIDRDSAAATTVTETVLVDDATVRSDQLDLGPATYGDVRLGVFNVSEKKAFTSVELDDVLVRTFTSL